MILELCFLNFYCRVDGRREVCVWFHRGMDMNMDEDGLKEERKDESGWKDRKQMDGQMNRWIGGWMGGWMDEQQMDGWMDGYEQTDRYGSMGR